ncbi:PAS-domain containing protein [Thermomonas haemolytica]|uniref:histidine kinase n=1 Tax=Thermomonas haemolytica TaxID=141949 RepID=A0A4R3NEX8_9GAMM|nr:PAS-domain containing protein [Thermomonas haemolytica]TCT25813.1 PAS domain S-box-containing protein [Thermomonas haemolytica]TNY30132.1 hybrid sensor histidine kinase/response regulator [Thermomonas haemolytica]
MLSVAAVVAAALLWLGLLFGTGLYAERHPEVFARHWRHVYALSLAVHCTSWTFYGTVTQAARYGWPLPPTFVGAILFYALAIAFMARLARLARESNATSLADLIATRLGKDAWLAAVVTLVAVLGLIPYIALQLQAITMSLATLTSGMASAADGAPPAWRDGALYVALAMAAFAILFGTRHVSAAGHNRGLVLALAFESLFKLMAMLALGAFVWFGLRGLPELSPPVPPAAAGGFMPLVLLGALAMFVMPHQFHVGVVECRDEADVRTARWQFPLYLLLIALPTLPLARAGAALLGDSVPTDMYALALPLAQGHAGLALLVFLGGLSAATGMVIVSTLTLSLMIGNHWFAPGLLRGAWAHAQGGDRRGDLLLLRRLGILLLMLLGWGYARLLSGNEALADVGAVSFSALATLAPALAFAVWRPLTPAIAATAGVLAGFAAWAWVMLVPMLATALGGDPHWLRDGPLGMSWLAPEAIFGLTGWSRLGRAVGASLFVGTVTTWLVAILRGVPRQRAARGADLATLRSAGLRFLPAERVEALLRGAPASGPVPARLESRLEHELAAVLGSASARLLLDAARRAAPGADLDTVAAIVGEASQDLRFNQRVLEAALENMSQGISVVDAQLRLVAWNRRYEELFGYPRGMLRVGMPIAQAARWALRRVAAIDPVQEAAALERRLAHMRAGTAHLSERVFPDGSIVEIRGNPMPGGGFVATFTDVTAFRQAEAGLMRVNETLEQRVAERTALLETAKREAEQANDAKSRFLAAIGHDLLQPLHAAHLFADALQQRGDGEQRELARQISSALDSTADLLTTLLDMSRLEAGGLVPEPRDLPLADVLEPLVAQFRALAAERGLQLRYVPTRAWVHSDPQLLRRVLQNFLANAVRYTARGKILLGVRRRDGQLCIEVHDTGPGISDAQREAIFEEFRRGDGAPGQGLGLGLAIARRIAGLLGSQIFLRSQPGRGSCFGLCLAPVEVQPQRPPAHVATRGLSGLRVLVVDNEAGAREALCRVLEGWGCQVHAVADGQAAAAVLAAAPCELWLLDYHLDDGDDGVALQARLAARFPPAPCLVLSADQTGAVRSAVQEAGLPLLAKPLRPLALKSMLDRLLAAHPPRIPG